MKLKFWLCIGIAALLVGWLHPRIQVLVLPKIFNRTLLAYMSGPVHARELWQLRDLASSGFHRNANREIPHGIIQTSFPQLSDYSYLQVFEYTGNTIDSLDLVMHSDDGLGLFEAITGKQPVMNQRITFEASDKLWLVALFDSAAAAKANGYYDANLTEADTLVWIQLSWIKGNQ